MISVGIRCFPLSDSNFRKRLSLEAAWPRVAAQARDSWDKRDRQRKLKGKREKGPGAAGGPLGRRPDWGRPRPEVEGETGSRTARSSSARSGPETSTEQAATWWLTEMPSVRGLAAFSVSVFETGPIGRSGTSPEVAFTRHGRHSSTLPPERQFRLPQLPLASRLESQSPRKATTITTWPPRTLLVGVSAGSPPTASAATRRTKEEGRVGRQGRQRGSPRCRQPRSHHEPGTTNGSARVPTKEGGAGRHERRTRNRLAASGLLRLPSRPRLLAGTGCSCPLPRKGEKARPGRPVCPDP